LICLEIGSGSGCVSSFIAQILGPFVLYLCTDINPHACRCSQRTGGKNNVSLECIGASFASPLMSRLRHQVDIILFNPPYVPTGYEEAQTAQQGKGLSGAWAGGHDGMGVTNGFLDVVKNGRFYLVALKKNNISEIQRRMLEEHDLESQVRNQHVLFLDLGLLLFQVVLRRQAGREHLFILRFTQKVP